MPSAKKQLYPRRAAFNVAQEIKALLEPACERIEIVGSLRREKSHVHDIELLFIPTIATCQDLLGAPESEFSLADRKLDNLLEHEVIAKRLSKAGHTAWGMLNKLAYHIDTSIPIDFFATTRGSWPVALFIRTGGKKMNLRVTMAANKLGYSLEAYGSGFRKLGSSTERHTVASEEEIFSFVKLPYLEPCLRP